MKRYLERHGGGTTTSTKEDWNDPKTAGSLSRWVLWNKPNLKSSFNDYKSRFGLKGSLNVSKSAETSKPHSVTISRSSNSEKKLMAVFEDNEGEDGDFDEVHSDGDVGYIDTPDQATEPYIPYACLLQRW